jgi:hypothetical protein
MKIRFLKTAAGVSFVFKKGNEYELEAENATKWVEIGFAEKVEIKEIKEIATTKRKRTTRKK